MLGCKVHRKPQKPQAQIMITAGTYFSSGPGQHSVTHMHPLKWRNCKRILHFGRTAESCCCNHLAEGGDYNCWAAEQTKQKSASYQPYCLILNATQTSSLSLEGPHQLGRKNARQRKRISQDLTCKCLGFVRVSISGSAYLFFFFFLVSHDSKSTALALSQIDKVRKVSWNQPCSGLLW